MRDVDGTRRPRPLASTTASSERPRTVKKASVSAGRGGTLSPRVNGHSLQTNAGKECVDSQREIIEGPNASSLMGLSQPELIAYEEIIDAANRGAIVKRLVNHTFLLLAVITLAVIAATLIGVSTSGLITYAKWLGALLIPLLSTAVGYYFGRAQSSRHRK